MIVRLSTAAEGFLYVKLTTCSPNTVAEYKNTLQQFIDQVGDMDLFELEAHHFQRFLYHLRVHRKLKAKTVLNAHTGLSAFCTWLEMEYNIAHIMRGRVERPKANKPEIIPLTKRDVRELLHACDRSAVWDSTKRAETVTRRPTRISDQSLGRYLTKPQTRCGPHSPCLPWFITACAVTGSREAGPRAPGAP